MKSKTTLSYNLLLQQAGYNFFDSIICANKNVFGVLVLMKPLIVFRDPEKKYCIKAKSLIDKEGSYRSDMNTRQICLLNFILCLLQFSSITEGNGCDFFSINIG